MDLKNYLYEFITLLLPIKRIHRDGECDPEMIRSIEEHAFVEKEEDVDPRWDKLKGLTNTEIE